MKNTIFRYIVTIANERSDGLSLGPGGSLEETICQLVPTGGVGEKVGEELTFSIREPHTDDNKISREATTEVLWAYLFS